MPSETNRAEMLATYWQGDAAYSEMSIAILGELHFTLESWHNLLPVMLGQKRWALMTSRFKGQERLAKVMMLSERRNGETTFDTVT